MLVFFDSIGVGIFDILSTAHVLSSSAVIGYVLDIGHLEPTYHSLSFLPFLFVSVMNNRFQVWIHVLSEVLLHSQTTRIHDVFQREEGGGGWRRVEEGGVTGPLSVSTGEKVDNVWREVWTLCSHLCGNKIDI